MAQVVTSNLKVSSLHPKLQHWMEVKSGRADLVATVGYWAYNLHLTVKLEARVPFDADVELDDRYLSSTSRQVLSSFTVNHNANVKPEYVPLASVNRGIVGSRRRAGRAQGDVRDGPEAPTHPPDRHPLTAPRPPRPPCTHARASLLRSSSPRACPICKRARKRTDLLTNPTRVQPGPSGSPAT